MGGRYCARCPSASTGLGLFTPKSILGLCTALRQHSTASCVPGQRGLAWSIALRAPHIGANYGIEVGSKFPVVKHHSKHSWPQLCTPDQRHKPSRWLGTAFCQPKCPPGSSCAGTELVWWGGGEQRGAKPCTGLPGQEGTAETCSGSSPQAAPKIAGPVRSLSPAVMD